MLLCGGVRAERKEPAAFRAAHAEVARVAILWQGSNMDTPACVVVNATVPLCGGFQVGWRLMLGTHMTHNAAQNAI